MLHNGILTQEGSLYSVMKSGVTGFRELVGAPDTPRWNSVLFGGKLCISVGIEVHIQ